MRTPLLSVLSVTVSPRQLWPRLTVQRRRRPLVGKKPTQIFVHQLTGMGQPGRNVFLQLLACGNGGVCNSDVADRTQHSWMMQRVESAAGKKTKISARASKIAGNIATDRTKEHDGTTFRLISTVEFAYVLSSCKSARISLSPRTCAQLASPQSEEVG